MKQTRYFHDMLFRAALCLGLLWPCLTAAQEIGSEEVPEKPVWSQNPNDSLKYGDRYRALENRRALVEPGSTVNKIVNVVGVGSWVQDLNNLTDEDLNNYVEFPKIVGAGVTVNPVTSVRDLNNHYAGGMKGGFCLVASSGTSVLSLDVIKAMSIQFYCDGAAVGDPVSVEEGQDASGVGLSLISIPGSEDACINVTATAPGEFDEVCLIDAGGVNLTVGSRVQVKYAFVGDAKQILLTYDGVDSMNEGMKDFSHYIYNTENNSFYVYIGITTSKENALKIVEYYKSLGVETVISEKITDNKEFVNILRQYDELLSKTDDSESIKTICNQILVKYEELVK